MAKLLRWKLSNITEMIVLTLLNKYDFVGMIEGNRGCLTGDTLVKTPSGNEKISDLKDDIILLIYDFKNKKIIESPAKKIDSGIKEVYEIITNDGKKIKATSDHVFFVKRNNKIIELPLKDLKDDDELVCVK